MIKFLPFVFLGILIGGLGVWLIDEYYKK